MIDSSFFIATPHEIHFAATTHDYKSITLPGPGYTLRAVAAEDFSNSATLASEDEIADAAMVTASFGGMRITGSGIPSWTCALLTFR